MRCPFSIRNLKKPARKDSRNVRRMLILRTQSMPLTGLCSTCENRKLKPKGGKLLENNRDDERKMCIILLLLDKMVIAKVSVKKW